MTDTAESTEDTDAAPDTGEASVTDQAEASSTPAPKSEQSDEQSDEGKTSEGEPGPLEILPPEGMEGFAPDFEAYQAHVSDWLKANPEATAADAFKAAAAYQAELVSKAQSTSQEEAAKAWDAQVEGWKADAKADKEIGGDAFDQNVAIASKALKAYGSEELHKILDDSGLGNHPEVIKAFWKMGKEMAEATTEPSSGLVRTYDPLKARYPNSSS